MGSPVTSTCVPSLAAGVAACMGGGGGGDGNRAEVCIQEGVGAVHGWWNLAS